MKIFPNKKNEPSQSVSAITSHQKKLADKWHSLAGRDKLALGLLAVFLFGVFGLYGGIEVHNNASKQHQLFDKKVNDFFWLRSQSGNLKAISSQGQNQDNKPLTVRVTDSIRRFGIASPTVAQAGDGVQFSFEHSSQAVISQVINQLQAQNLQINRLKIIQDEVSSMIRVQGTIQSSQS